MLIPGAAIGAKIFGAESAVGDVVDFFNPLSDLQDLVDLVDPSEQVEDWPCP